MNYYNKKPIYPVYLSRNGERFLVPFLLGGLAGGAAVGLTRPRPIINAAPQPQFIPNYNMPFANYNYSYYVPNNYYPY